MGSHWWITSTVVLQEYLLAGTRSFPATASKFQQLAEALKYLKTLWPLDRSCVLLIHGCRDAQLVCSFTSVMALGLSLHNCSISRGWLLSTSRIANLKMHGRDQGDLLKYINTTYSLQKDMCMCGYVCVKAAETLKKNKLSTASQALSVCILKCNVNKSGGSGKPET